MRLVSMDYEYHVMVINLLPVWVAEMIVPVAFSVMTLRLLLQAAMLFRDRK